jgi:hypothetical protein
MVFDLASELPLTVCSAEHHTIYDMLDTLYTLAWTALGHIPEKGECVFYAMGGTLAAHCNQGIATRMAEKFIEQGKQQGYRGVYCQSTTPYTTRIFEKLGMLEKGVKMLTTLRYSSFKDKQGIKTFEHLSGEAQGMMISI